MKKTILIITLAIFGLSTANAQVGIGTTTPDTSSILDVTATDKGFLPPRMSEAQRDNISSPAEGLTIYNTDDDCLNVYVGLGWRNLCAIVGPNDVLNPETGQIWMDRNLGANQVATASDDAAAYGDLYQWGRAADGHEKVFRVSGDAPTSGTYDGDTNGFPSTATASGAWDGLFITTSTSPKDWLGTNQDNTLWQGVNGTNNPCPAGYRVPTIGELNNERFSWSSNNAAGAYASPLKLTQAGRRIPNDGRLDVVGGNGFYYSSTVKNNGARLLATGLNVAFVNNGGDRGYGISVRCIKD